MPYTLNSYIHIQDARNLAQDARNLAQDTRNLFQDACILTQDEPLPYRLPNLTQTMIFLLF